MPSAENSRQPASRAPFITRVVLRDYRSIEACDVALGPLTFLVGPNGSGKSNFLDALRLIADALRTSLDHAIRERGGIFNIVRRAPGGTGQFEIRLDFQLHDGAIGHFSVSVGGTRGYVVHEEECAVGEAKYHVRAGKLLLKPSPVSPPASDDRLYLVNAAGIPEFRPVFDALSDMGLYSISPDQLRAPQAPDAGEFLARDGSNLPSVLARLTTQTDEPLKRRIEEYLGAIVPGLKGVENTSIVHMETLKFLQHIEGTEGLMAFPAISMSDGTLRALGILVALFQTRVNQRIQLVGIEEPEVSLHPAAAGVLRDALRDASQYTQVIVTSHSPELLDDPSIHGDEILSVVADQGKSLIAPVDEETRSALRDRLYTAGELLKANQLSPDRSAVPQPDQLKLWEHDT
ncbi:AAA family ATPase [Corallococcus llansteffanensis]|uniref:Chromosome segregation protein SMC n=1 Tax=Corallococcus llansteffanensis TaxID=2316731 RepID=A0A3A8NUB1_9BACT|nr:ATP-binding protein [Corallococcus llansteffanensis]RKH47987.1 chromosome segregation protein SMC [Corallococcus llansteffanensis]